MKLKLIFLLSLFLLNQQYYINGMIDILNHPGVDHFGIEYGFEWKGKEYTTKEIRKNTGDSFW